MLLSKDELEIEGLEREIMACNIVGRTDEGFEKIALLQQISKSDDQLTRQFILRSKALLGASSKLYTEAEQIELLMQAIKLTIRNFSLDEIEGHLYTRDEIKIINQIANAYHFPITTKKQLIFFTSC